MGSNIKVFLYGSLKRDYSGAGVDKPIALNLRSPAPLPEILAVLGIPAEKVQVAMVNHHAVSKKTLIRPTAYVELAVNGEYEKAVEVFKKVTKMIVIIG